MLEQWIDTVCRTAGWTRPAVDSRGVFRFRLEGGRYVDASSEDGRTLRLSSELGSLAGGGADDRLMQKAALAAVARLGTDTGVLSLDRKRGVLCYDAFHLLGVMRASDMHVVLQRYLDELDFWLELCNAS
ncbi:type III secretion system chaperone [Desulfocurvus sp. DL9XJH121]